MIRHRVCKKYFRKWIFHAFSCPVYWSLIVTSCESCQTRRPKPVVNCFDVAPHTITKLLSFLATKLSLSLEALKVWNEIQLNLPTHMKTMFLNLNLNSLSQRCEPTIIANTLRNWFAAFVKKEETTCWLMKLSLLPASCYLCFLSKTKVKLKFFLAMVFGWGLKYMPLRTSFCLKMTLNKNELTGSVKDMRSSLFAEADSYFLFHFSGFLSRLDWCVCMQHRLEPVPYFAEVFVGIFSVSYLRIIENLERLTIERSILEEFIE